jgi:hypothetical protein
MTSRPTRSAGDLDALLELLNASEGVVDRDVPPSEVPEPLEPEPLEPESLQPNASEAEAQSADAVEAAVDTSADIKNDEIENRFAAHIVRGMSKSKSG